MLCPSFRGVAGEEGSIVVFLDKGQQNRQQKKSLNKTFYVLKQFNLSIQIFKKSANKCDF
jgi:hypothetical protein